MNWVEDAVNQVGGLAFADLPGRIGRGMPHHFLASSLDLEPGLEPWRGEIQAITDSLAGPAGELAHRNPEVFAQITHLTTRARKGADVAPMLEALRVQLGLSEPSGARLADGLLRLPQIDGAVWAVQDGRPRRLDERLVAAVPGFPGKVLLPFTDLFRDLVSRELYPAVAAAYDADYLIGLVARGLRLLREHAPGFVPDLADVVRTLVLVPDFGDEARWSYNLRLAYFGAVFINPFAVGPWGMAESILHEYCHQRLWQWWAYEPPSGVPPATEKVRSPVTDRDKPVPVMIHALLIYAAAHAFYRRALEADAGSGDERLWVDERAAGLEAAIPLLHERLAARLRRGTTAARLIDHVYERFACREMRVG